MAEAAKAPSKMDVENEFTFTDITDKINALNLKKPNVGSKVYNDQCVLTFRDPFSDDGIFVNLTSFQSFAREYVNWDHDRTGNPCYLNIKKRRVEVKKEENQQEVSKLGIGVDGGFSLDGNQKVETELVLCLLPSWECMKYPGEKLLPEIKEAIDDVASHSAPDTNVSAAWVDDEVQDSIHAADLIQINPNNKKISSNAADWKCEESGATKNLWLNLSDGHIGDGRSNWDGSGGNNGALNHFKQMQAEGKNFPIVVKLGTITPDGADCYDYALNMPCKDPKLAEHLAFWGIDVMQQVKTVKTTAERELELNANFDFSLVMGNEKLDPVNGAGLIGLDNLGNSCYMNSVLQTLFCLPAFREKYLDNHQLIIDSIPKGCDVAEDFPMQMAKLARGLLTDDYIAPNTTMTAVKPQMLRALAAKGHAEFSSKRQQDAQEYIMHFLDWVQNEENKYHQRLNQGASLGSMFKFEVEERFMCNASKQVRYSDAEQGMLSLNIDLNKASNLADITEQREAKRQKVEQKSDEDLADKKVDVKSDSDEILPDIPFNVCLEDWMLENVPGWRSPISGEATGAEKTLRFKTFPSYLLIQMQRYFVNDKWVPEKKKCIVNVPAELDLEQYRAKGLQEGETELPNDRKSTFEPKEELINAVMMMGFTRNAGIRAAKATNNGSSEQCVNWVCSHLDDADLNDPLPAEGNDSGPPAEMVQQLVMISGCPEEHAKFALSENNNNVEIAMNWYFENMMRINDLIAQKATQESLKPGLTNGPGKYRLKAIISHLGNHQSSGHYVCHIQKDGNWYLFNDNKVALAQEPPFGVGYLYLFERV